MIILPFSENWNFLGSYTCCPSTTPFGLILGPDSPSMDKPYGGTLRILGHWILTNVCVTQVDILAFASSTHLLKRVLPPKVERSPTDIFLLFTSHSFGKSYSPVHLWRSLVPSNSHDPSNLAVGPSVQMVE